MLDGLLLSGTCVPQAPQAHAEQNGRRRRASFGDPVTPEAPKGPIARSAPVWPLAIAQLLGPAEAVGANEAAALRRLLRQLSPIGAQAPALWPQRTPWQRWALHVQALVFVQHASLRHGHSAERLAAVLARLQQGLALLDPPEHWPAEWHDWLLAAPTVRRGASLFLSLAAHARVLWPRASAVQPVALPFGPGVCLSLTGPHGQPVRIVVREPCALLQQAAGRRLLSQKSVLSTPHEVLGLPVTHRLWPQEAMASAPAALLHAAEQRACQSDTTPQALALWCALCATLRPNAVAPAMAPRPATPSEVAVVAPAANSPSPASFSPPVPLPLCAPAVPRQNAPFVTVRRHRTSKPAAALLPTPPASPPRAAAIAEPVAPAPSTPAPAEPAPLGWSELLDACETGRVVTGDIEAMLQQNHDQLPLKAMRRWAAAWGRGAAHSASWAPAAQKVIVRIATSHAQSARFATESKHALLAAGEHGSEVGWALLERLGRIAEDKACAWPSEMALGLLALAPPTGKSARQQAALQLHLLSHEPVKLTPLLRKEAPPLTRWLACDETVVAAAMCALQARSDTPRWVARARQALGPAAWHDALRACPPGAAGYIDALETLSDEAIDEAALCALASALPGLWKKATRRASEAAPWVHAAAQGLKERPLAYAALWEALAQSELLPATGAEASLWPALSPACAQAVPHLLPALQRQQEGPHCDGWRAVLALHLRALMLVDEPSCRLQALLWSRVHELDVKSAASRWLSQAQADLISAIGMHSEKVPWTEQQARLGQLLVATYLTQLQKNSALGLQPIGRVAAALRRHDFFLFAMRPHIEAGDVAAMWVLLQPHLDEDHHIRLAARADHEWTRALLSPQPLLQASVSRALRFSVCQTRIVTLALQAWVGRVLTSESQWVQGDSARTGAVRYKEHVLDAAQVKQALQGDDALWNAKEAKAHAALRADLCMMQKQAALNIRWLLCTMTEPVPTGPSTHRARISRLLREQGPQALLDVFELLAQRPIAVPQAHSEPAWQRFCAIVRDDALLASALGDYLCATLQTDCALPEQPGLLPLVQLLCEHAEPAVAKPVVRLFLQAMDLTEYWPTADAGPPQASRDASWRLSVHAQARALAVCWPLIDAEPDPIAEKARQVGALLIAMRAARGTLFAAQRLLRAVFERWPADNEADRARQMADALAEGFCFAWARTQNAERAMCYEAFFCFAALCAPDVHEALGIALLDRLGATAADTNYALPYAWPAYLQFDALFCSSVAQRRARANNDEASTTLPRDPRFFAALVQRGKKRTLHYALQAPGEDELTREVSEWAAHVLAMRQHAALEEVFAANTTATLTAAWQNFVSLCADCDPAFFGTPKAEQDRLVEMLPWALADAKQTLWRTVEQMPAGFARISGSVQALLASVDF